MRQSNLLSPSGASIPPLHGRSNTILDLQLSSFARSTSSIECYIPLFEDAINIYWLGCLVSKIRVDLYTICIKFKLARWSQIVKIVTFDRIFERAGHFRQNDIFPTCVHLWNMDDSRDAITTISIYLKRSQSIDPRRSYQTNRFQSVSIRSDK